MRHILFLLISCFVSIQIVAQNFTIIAMPDTQHYCDEGTTEEEIFKAQTQWIVDNRVSKNIVFVTGLGDIVQNADEPDEWALANTAYGTIEDSSPPPTGTGLTDGIPYGLVVGNCDQFPKRQTGATSEYNTHFGVSRFNGRGYYGGNYGSKNDNSYQLFSAGPGLDFIIIHLEYDQNPSQQQSKDVLTWADGLLTTYSNRRAIISSHFIIDRGNEGDTPTAANEYPGRFGAQGDSILNKLKNHENLFLMLGGHIATEGERDDVGTNGNTIYTLLSDYQNQPNGGNGWLRIMEFSPGTNTITVSTFSPTLVDPNTNTLGVYGNTPFEDMGGDDPNDFGGTGSISAPFTLSYDMTTALPVELVDFQVRKEGKESLISWTTASEENNKGFEIQKSNDGVSWKKLTWVDGLGTSNITQSYSYTDTEPHRGINYYRLRQLDYDDTENYSQIRVVTFALEAPIIYPNPVLDELTIQMPGINNGKVIFEIKDIMGRVVMVEKINLVDKMHKINTRNLDSGVYYLDIQSQFSSVSYPFVKTN